MATALKNLSEYDPAKVPAAKNMRFAIVVSEWNSGITFSLLEGAYNTLIKHGADPDHIRVNYVPGSFELTAGATALAETKSYDAVICIGCVIQGETPHFDYICQGITYGLTQLNIEYKIPFVFCILTTNTLQQAKDRSGGKHGNKGDEAAVTAIKMVALKQNI
ncbi:MAG: 6,7-dimethyl-8-ribityllumazine synthase [Bacteroidales bacterium]|nr:6,7-dimethyl-8-ribityllumazine synthase [Bacteroidales bacterium]